MRLCRPRKGCGVIKSQRLARQTGNDEHEHGDNCNIEGECNEDGIDPQYVPYDTIRGFLTIVRISGL